MGYTKSEILEAVDMLLKHRNNEIPAEVYDEVLVMIRRLVQYHGQKFGVIDKMARLYESGTPVAEIEKATGRDRTWIYECLKRLGVKIRPHGRRGGETHPCWKGGRYVDRTGYIRLRNRAHFTLFFPRAHGEGAGCRWTLVSGLFFEARPGIHKTADRPVKSIEIKRLGEKRAYPQTIQLFQLDQLGEGGDKNHISFIPLFSEPVE
jgi:hypothetical protein